MAPQSENSVILARVFPFEHDIHGEGSCLVRSASHGKGEHVWHIFVLGQVLKNRKEPVKPLLHLYSHIHQKVRDMMRTNDAIDPEFVFDEVLTQLNESYKGVFKKSDVEYLKKASFAIGLIKGGRLCIADRGQMIGKMVMKTGASFTLIPVLGVVGQAHTSPHLFTSIVCGALPERSRIAIGTSQLRAVGRNDVFIQLLSKRTTPLEDIWQRMQKKLKLAKDPTLAGVLIETFTPQNSSSTEGVKKPVRGAHDTKNLMHTTGTPRILRKWLRTLGEAISYILSRFHVFGSFLRRRMPRWIRFPSNVTHKVSETKSKMSSLTSKVSQNSTTRTIWKSGRQLISGIARAILLFLLWLTSALYRPIKKMALFLWKSFLRLTIVQKVALIGVLGALIGIILSVHISQIREADAQRLARIQALTEQFTERYTIAESKLVFGNIPEAKRALQDAQRALDELSILQFDVTDLSASLQVVRSEILKDHPIPLDEPMHASSYSLQGIASFPGHPLVWGEGTIRDLITERETPLSHPITPSTLFGSDSEGVIFLTDEELSYFVPSSSSFESGVINSAGIQEIRGIQLFSGRLYSVDASGTIYRHNASSDGFARGVVWAEQDNQGANSIAIDGNVYVTNDRGEMFKYFKGERVPFSISSIEPPLGKNVQLFTSGTSDYVYISDLDLNRLVVINKSGLMRVQYTVEATVTGFAVDESNQRGYVLIGDRVHHFRLTHISP